MTYARTDDEFRAAVMARLCPVCGAGPYALLASHTVQKHGLGAWDLRDRAGLIAKESISAPELRAQRMRQGKANYDKHGLPHQGPGYKIRRTRAGNDEQRRKALRNLIDSEINDRRVKGISQALTEKAKTDREFHDHLATIGRRQAKQNRKQRACSVCGRKFWRTPETRDRRTCSEECETMMERKGLRTGWALKKAGKKR